MPTNARSRPDDKPWIRSTLAHQATGATPYNFGFSPPARAQLEKYLGTNKLEETLRFPIRMSGPDSIKPLYASPARYGPTIRDEFGVIWSTSEIDRGAPIIHCLPEPDLSNYRFPNPSDEYRFAGLADWTTANAGHYTMLWVGDLWERATFMRGMENILLDLSLEPRFVELLLRGLADYVLATMRILFDRFTFDGIAFGDDYGTQHGLIMSPQHWRRFVRPLVAEIYALAKKNGRTVFQHSCGHIVPIIGDLIDIGLDILHPIQPEAMDVFWIKKEFGRHVTLCGGLGTQEFLPKATPEQVRQQVRHLKEQLGGDGGYILEPGITLQADIPLANLVALVEEASFFR
jgi:uroporphyrinogen decarboxylase